MGAIFEEGEAHFIFFLSVSSDSRRGKRRLEVIFHGGRAMAESTLLRSRPERADLRPAALLPLVSLCVSELRSDLVHLVESGWDEFPRRRADELLSALADACARQGLRPLAILFRSIRSLVALSPEEANRLGRGLDRKLKELLRVAEGLVREQSSREIA